MATATSSPRASGGELKLAILIGFVTLVALLGAWAYTRLSSQPEEPKRPVPTWLGVSPVTAQTADGRILSVKVNLLLKNEEDLDVLRPYEPAFKSLVAEAGSGFDATGLRGPDRILEFGVLVKESVNEYLNEQQVKPRIKRVAFEEFKLMP